MPIAGIFRAQLIQLPCNSGMQSHYEHLTYLYGSSWHLGHFIPRFTAVFTWSLTMVQADSHRLLNAEPWV